jgi:hypothetical protein
MKYRKEPFISTIIKSERNTNVTRSLVCLDWYLETDGQWHLETLMPNQI